jgi:hypothetical protein
MADDLMGVSPSLGDAAVLPTITFAGKSWTVGAPTQKAKSAFEDFVVQIASANVERQKGNVPAAKWEQLNDRLDGEIESGQYLTWGKLWNRINDSPESPIVYLASLLKERHDDATLELARQMIKAEPRQVRRALARGVPSFFSLIVQEWDSTTEEQNRLLAELMAGFATAMQGEPTSSPAPTN